ncbi:hypothetical protein FisN_10Lh012 [Fistulifera solaris]|uniref:Uncharacterized protein n=1 Tax=Fistulifera solaris TaxID=1519565 RepID=A0A1Z5JTG6_FISSO|nr:hypothetical protein FisN_10Lh012 [Fistulifera solaris]|eukprot:GAX17166.1 hypothetical protein FisN_10Lh012 [Fistulifera solaris]
MPRVGMIGNRSVPARGDRPHLQLSAQSAEIRNLARQLGMIQDSQIAEQALKDAIVQTPLYKHLCKDDATLLHKKIETTLYRWRKRGILTQRTFPIRMAQAVESALSAVMTNKPKDSKVGTAGGRKASGQRGNTSNPLGENTSSTSPPQSDFATPGVSTGTSEIAFVSDSEGVARHSSREDREVMDVDLQLAVTDFWPNLLEAIGLQVASRRTSTTRSKKVYELYKLAGPCIPVTDQQGLRQEISKEFLKVFHTSHKGTRLIGQSECRVFSVQQEDSAALWMQINIGRPIDVRDQILNKKGIEGNEFIILIVPESNLVALTASRAASRSIYTPYIMFVLETVLTCSVAGGYASGGVITRRMHNLSGTEPLDLLRTANAIEASDAVGRYANYASQGKTTDPIIELQHAANENLLFRTSEALSEKSDRYTSRLARKVSQQSQQQTEIVSVNEYSVCLDQNASEKQSRKRMRIEELGQDGDCPIRQSVKWDWKGSTDAGTAVWGTGYETKHETFKCRLSLKGSDVFAGMQALLDAGILEGPLPHYMRDAPMLGGRIVVDHSVIKKVCKVD